MRRALTAILLLALVVGAFFAARAAGTVLRRRSRGAETPRQAQPRDAERARAAAEAILLRERDGTIDHEGRAAFRSAWPDSWWVRAPTGPGHEERR